MIQGAAPGTGGSRAPEEWDDIRLAAALRSGWRRAQAAMTRALAEHGLSNLEYHVLLVISAAGEAGLRQIELAQEVNAPEARVSLLAHHLAQRGLIEAGRSEPDRRYVRLRATPEGERVLRSAMRCQRDGLATLVRQFPEEAVVRLVEYLMRRYLGLDLTVQRTGDGA
ncbi:MAG TPA: MarR family winged helix-turn-helix transcriptional regulator [Candidatus Dormibacteraeota bacterium]|nr:MarR family winged helix-turn-helix transcriptional regulator [Candidatus Dormibacteraeota bacterium]